MAAVNCPICDTNSLWAAGQEGEWCANAFCPSNADLNQSFDENEVEVMDATGSAEGSSAAGNR